MGFDERNVSHKEAVIVINEIFESLGWRSHEMGIEIDDREFYQTIRSLNDPLSRMLRFRPDGVCTKTQSVLCEVKTAAKKYSNFSIEMDSYSAGLIWNKLTKTVMIACIDPDIRMACWIDDLPIPDTIFVPRPWDEIRMMNEWQNSKIVPKPSNGSGTPFMLIPKTYKCFVTLEDFIKQIDKNSNINLLDSTYVIKEMT